jgi:hypothetical protein
MFFVPKALPKLLFVAGVLSALICAPTTLSAASPESLPKYPDAVKAEFRGCESAGWCRFWIELLDPLAKSPYRVYPDGVARSPDDNAVSIAIRDRMNALLANMIHQYKRIVLHDLREVGDGTFEATVTISGSNLALDPMLLELQGTLMGTTQ